MAHWCNPQTLQPEQCPKRFNLMQQCEFSSDQWLVSLKIFLGS